MTNSIDSNVSFYGKIAPVNSKKVKSKETNKVSLDYSGKDSLELTSENAVEYRKKLTNKLKSEVNKTKEEQGLLGKFWDGFKNITHIGASSKKALKAISNYENGKISKEQMEKAINNYKEGQKQCVDMIADVVSGIASFGAFSIATGLGIAASPFTGGASLGLVGVGFGLAGLAGSLTKVGIKGIDCAVGNRKYDSLGYDLATGGINGIFAPITAGIGGAVGKTVARKVGVTALREGGEIAVQEALKGTAKGALAKTLLTTNVKYVGGSMGARALALGADMAVNGAISGAVDSGTRYAAGDSENKSLEGFAKEVGAGTLGGLIMSPIIGGGMRLAGNGVGKLTGKLENKISKNYTKAKNAMMNAHVEENPDLEVVKGLSNIYKEFQDAVENYTERSTNTLNALGCNVNDLSNNLNSIFKNATALNDELSILSKENRELITEILEEIAQGKDASSKIAQLSQKGISIVEAVDEKVGSLSNEFGEKIKAIITSAEGIENATSDRIAQTAEMTEKLGKIAGELSEQAGNIQNTKIYEQLGDMPDRVKTMYNTLRNEANSLDEAAQAAKNKILSGNVEEGLEELRKYYDSLEVFQKSMDKHLGEIQTTANNSGLADSLEILKERYANLTSSERYLNMTKTQQEQALVENTNILLAKFAQTFSGMDDLPPEMSDLLRSFTSKCKATRSPQEAQEFINKLYGEGKYTFVRDFGGGTIGETYLATTQDGKQVIVKALKKGVTPEKFAEDRKMFTNYINEFVSDASDKEYKLKLINGMFDAWDKELDFGIEAQNAKKMANGAERFKVCQTLELGVENGQNVSLVMEKADGVALDKLLEMVEFYKKHPDEYLTKYAQEIKEHPALKTPDKWTKKLGPAFQKAQNEQVMFVGESGKRTIHGDPHAGNVFVDFDTQKFDPKITYIDTGNVVERTSAETLDDICLSLNMMLGNSKGVADAMLEGAILPSGASKAEVSEKLAKILDERLYKADVNLKSTQYTQNTINNAMKELNIIVNPNNSNLMKATLQRIETSRAINGVCGTSSSKVVDIKDLARGVLKSLKKDRKGTMKKIIPILKWAKENDDQAMQTFFQMIIKQSTAEA